MNERKMTVALDALGMERDQFDELVEQISVETGERPEPEELIVHLHMVNTFMQIAEQTGSDLDVMLQNVPDDCPIYLDIDEHDDGSYDIRIKFGDDEPEPDLQVEPEDES